MNLKSLLIGAIAIAATSCASHSTKMAATGPTEVKGTIHRMLYNPEKDVDGFVLLDGTEVHFAPRAAAELAPIAAVKETVEVSGQRDEDNVILADKITNVRTSRSVAELQPRPLMDRPDGIAATPPAYGPAAHKGMRRSVSGTVQSQLFGPQGELNGVVLTDGTVVHMGPRLLEDSNVSAVVGDRLRISGFMSEGPRGGKSLEATEVSTY